MAGNARTGTSGTVTELARAERIDQSYVGRLLRLPLLSPDIIESILNGRQSEIITLAALMQTFPMQWEKQRANLG